MSKIEDIKNNKLTERFSDDMKSTVELFTWDSAAKQILELTKRK